MYTLYIDTHFSDLVLGLFKDGILIDERRVVSNKHSEFTINLLDKLLKDNVVDIDLVKEVIVITGPGSFTGVRIGIVVAKMLSFAKGMKIKALSYLEAMALNYDFDVTLGIKERNGVFGARFDKNHELKGDYFYLTNDEVLKLEDDIIYDAEVDLNKVYSFMKNKKEINMHELKPLYVKKIMVEYD